MPNVAPPSIPSLPRSPQGWTDLFMLACYFMAVACVYGGLQKSLARADRRAWTALKELLVFGFFVFMFWSLESYAHERTPYYLYSRSFRDLIPQAHYFTTWIQGLPRSCDACTQAVDAFVRENLGKIPLSVVLLEASLTYAALHTAKLLKGPLGSVGARPAFAGLVLFTVDALLDPVVAMGHRCPAAGEALPTAPFPTTGNGLGLWHWYNPQQGDLFQCAGKVCKEGELHSGVNLLAPYFHIPLFNYAAWLGAPIILVSLVSLFGEIRRDWVPASFQRLLGWLGKKEVAPEPGISHKQVGLLLGVFLTVAFVVYSAPARDLSVPTQYSCLAAALAVVLVIFVYNFGTFEHVERVDATLVQPVALGLAIPALAGLLTGQFTARPLLMPVAVVALAVGLWLGWLPYRGALTKVSRFVGDVDRFTRVHYFGFTAMLTLLGASYYTNALGRVDGPSNRVLLGLLLVAACFHVFAYVSNDVFDLDVDRQSPKRQRDPLVTGQISVATALAIALSAIPVSLLTTLLLVDFSSWQTLRCLGVLAAAYLLMTFYNWKGKRLRVPLFTDAIQGISWGLLALYGALVTGASNDTSLATALEKCWVLGAYGAGFIFLINGIHGGLRDLPTDLREKRRTTAILLGAQPDPAAPGRVKSSFRIMAFAHGVHLAMYGLVGYFLWLHRMPNQCLIHLNWAIGVAAVLFAISLYVLQKVVAIDSDDRNEWVSWGLFVLLLPPVGMFLLTAPLVTALKVAVLLSFMVPLGLQQDHLDKLISVLYQHGGLKGCVARTMRSVLRRKPSDTTLLCSSEPGAE